MYEDIEKMLVLVFLRKLLNSLTSLKPFSGLYFFFFFNKEDSKAKQLLRTAMNFLTACSCSGTVTE